MKKRWEDQQYPWNEKLEIYFYSSRVVTSTKISVLKRLYSHLFCKGLVFMLFYLYVLTHTGVLYQLHDGYHHWSRNHLPVRSTLFHQRILVSCVFLFFFSFCHRIVSFFFQFTNSDFSFSIFKLSLLSKAMGKRI